MPPLRPVEKETGRPIPYDRYAPVEKRSHGLATHRELYGLFGHGRPLDPRTVDVVNIRRSIDFLKGLPAELVDADTETALSDLTELLSRVEEKPARARA